MEEQLSFFGGEIKTSEQRTQERIKNYKFKAHKGKFKLNGVIIEYTFKPFYLSTTNHMEFDSDKKPNLISGTGYRSWFFNPGDVEEYDTIREVVEEFIKVQADGKHYELEWLGPDYGTP